MGQGRRHRPSAQYCTRPNLLEKKRDVPFRGAQEQTLDSTGAKLHVLRSNWWARLVDTRKRWKETLRNAKVLGLAFDACSLNGNPSTQSPALPALQLPKEKERPQRDLIEKSYIALPQPSLHQFPPSTDISQHERYLYHETFVHLKGFLSNSSHGPPLWSLVTRFFDI